MSGTTVEQRADWGRLTERLSAASVGHEVTIEIVDAEGGDASMVERLPFSGITYDRKDDVLVVAVGGGGPRFPVQLRHVIEHPTEIQFDAVRHGAALKVTDASGTTTLISILRRSDRGDPGAPQL